MTIFYLIRHGEPDYTYGDNHEVYGAWTRFSAPKKR